MSHRPVVGALLLPALLGATPLPAWSAQPREYRWISDLAALAVAARSSAAKALIASGDRSLVPGIVDQLFFVPKARRAEVFAVLTALTGEPRGERYLDWVELVGAHPEWTPSPGYAAFKADLFARIDARYRKILDAGHSARIRREEIVFGGVGVEGIPALDNPVHLSPPEVSLEDTERVFGASVNGAAIAYPLRYLSWHEMTNDRVGGEPVTLSYCTLCGSGVLYATRTPSGEPFTFGTSGLLYRSNKLMLDRRTMTLWNNLTGEPVLGPLAAQALRLELLPSTLTTWAEWRRRNPRTQVAVPDPATAKAAGFDYTPGAADRARSGVSFPVWQKSRRLPDKEEVFVLRHDAAKKAYAIAAVLKVGLLNDQVGNLPVLVLGDPESGAVRAYRRGDLVFRLARSGELLDQSDRTWLQGEAALTQEGDPAAVLTRLPGHVAFWFGWFGFFPDTEVFGAEP